MFLALGCVGFVASAPLLAQATDGNAQPAEGQRLGGMVVTDTAIDETGYKGDVQQSPKFTAPLLDTPRSVVVVPQQVIKDTGSATLVEALRTVPGITFGAAEGGNPIGDRPFIRGFDSQGSTYLDGVRDIGAQTREIFAVEQIQIVRGSDSTLGGRGSAGGSLNVISKLPRDENFVSGAVSYGTDDYKRVTGDVNYMLSDIVGVRISGMYHDQDVAGRDAIYQKRWGIAPSITIGLGTPTRLTASYYHLDTDELPDSGIPFLYTLTNAPAGLTYSQPAIGDVTTIDGTSGHVKRSTFYGLKDRDFRSSKTDQLTLRFEHEFDSGITIRNTSRYSHNSQAYIFLLPDDSQGNVFGTSATPVAGNVAAGGGYVWRRANTRFGYTDAMINQTDLFGEFHTGAIKHVFAIGAELSHEKAVRGAFVIADGRTTPRCTPLAVSRFYCTSLFNPNPNDPWVNYSDDTATGVPTPIVEGAPITRTRNDAHTKAVYAFDSISITDQLIVNLGARFDSFKSTVIPGQAATATDTFAISRKDDLFNWQAGVVFKPTANTSLYASYATAATPPNSLLGEGQEQNSLGTTVAAAAIADALKVEKTKSWEVGGKAELFNSALSLNIAVFQTKTRNARALGDANTIAFIGERRIRGVEFGFNGNITDAWNVFGGYTYLDAEITDGGFTALTAPAVGAQLAQVVLVPSVNNGRQFPQTAKHSFSLWTNFDVTPALSIGGGAFYTSRVFGGYQDNRSAVQDAAGVVTVNPATKIVARTVPSYWRFDARIGYKVNDQIDLSVNVQNLTDKVYFNQTYTSHYAGIAPGRSAFATLNFKY